ncbi:MAG: type VII secretion target [Propionibacteriaceae bacterium]|nr:hypothetical protein [Micropruina sp.]HBX82303.1 hypothetical protein [Propionibacteriaceae bacterium]HBY22807.1 hypothetical protein [Propionibacteriaceae bacterium]
MTELQVDTTTLRKHADDLSSDGESIGEGVSAAGVTQQSVDGGAFGLMCAFLTPWVNNCIAANTAQLAACQDLLSQLGGAVGEMATDFEATDQATQARFEQVHQGMPT